MNKQTDSDQKTGLNGPFYVFTISTYPQTFQNLIFFLFQSEIHRDRLRNSGIKPLKIPCDAFRNQYPLSMKGRNVDNVCFPTIEPHRRCDSEAEPVINVCFTWHCAFNAHRQKRGQRRATQYNLIKYPSQLLVHTLN